MIFYILISNKMLFFKNKKLNLWQKTSIAIVNKQSQETCEEIIFFDNSKNDTDLPNDIEE